MHHGSNQEMCLKMYLSKCSLHSSRPNPKTIKMKVQEIFLALIRSPTGVQAVNRASGPAGLKKRPA